MNFSEKQIKAIQYLKKMGILLPNNISFENIKMIKQDEQEIFLQVLISNDQIEITYSKDFLLFRSLFIILPLMIQSGETKKVEVSSISEIAYSLDASRNGVMKVASIKQFIAYLAVMGFNTFYLYIEDTYEVDGLDYFGYQRGAYSINEIKEIVEFAHLFDMEVIPSIQTLAHLTQFLKWPANHEIMDDANTLLIGELSTYETIEKMLIACKNMFETNRIHLGMDEAYQAGLGRYLALNGYTSRVDLMIYHIKKVHALTEKYQLKPIIWSDFIYKLLDQTNSSWLYDPRAEINSEKGKELPNGLTMVHWDYGGEDVAKYETVIDKHLEFCDLDHYIFAGGAHIWNRLAPNHGKSINTIKASIKACKNKGVKSVMLTTWGDDGQETDHWHSLISAVNYVQEIYSVIDEHEVNIIFDNLFGQGTYDMMYFLRLFDEVPSVEKDNPNMTNISKSLLWQDPLFGKYDFHVMEYNKISKISLAEYYELLADDIKVMKLYASNDLFIQYKEHFQKLAEALAIKSNFTLELRECRIDNDINGLKELSSVKIPKLINILKSLQESHYQIWHHTYKVNGWEVIELRYAGLISRLETVMKKINLYLLGDDSLEELLEEQLPYCEYSNPIVFSGGNYHISSSTGYN